MIKFDEVVRGVKHTVSENSPAILMGLGIAGMITTTILAVKATPKALVLMEERKDELSTVEYDVDKLPPMEVVKTTWRCYAPAVVLGLTSIFCLVGSNSVHARRTAAVLAAQRISEAALNEYREKVVETVGPSKALEIKDKIDKDHVDKNPVSQSQVIVTGKGNTLCYDRMFGQYFESDIEKINKAVNELNKRLFHDSYISLNEFYSEIGVDHIDIGDELGWNVEHGLIEVTYSTQLSDDDRPCVVLEYDIRPKYGYDRL